MGASRIRWRLNQTPSWSKTWSNAAAIGSWQRNRAIFDQHNPPAKIGSSNSLIPTVVSGESSGGVRTAGLADSAPRFVGRPSDTLLADDLNVSHWARIDLADSPTANSIFDEVDTSWYEGDELECVAEGRVLQAAL